MRPDLHTLFIALLALAFAGATQAQATRTWVSGVGDDANPCSRTAPCKTFAGAISKTAAGGVINALDPAGFGGVTITKSITIEAEGQVAGILNAGSTGMGGFNGSANDRVLNVHTLTNALASTGVTVQVRGVHFSFSGKGAKIASIQSSVTASGLAGSHLGLLSLSMISARTPSMKSCI